MPSSLERAEAVAREYGVATACPLGSQLATFADALREGGLRTELGSSDLAPLCVEAVGDPAACTAALRVVANLCIDHGG